MDDLNFVIFMENGCLPLRAANDLLIEFYCNLFRLQSEAGNQLREGYLVLHFSSLAIDLDAQGFSLTSPGRMNNPTQFPGDALSGRKY
jgi:hypothetical protein